MSEERIEPAIVIGLGVGGVTASIYLSRMGIQPLAFEGGQIGGHVLKLETIDDYSGFKGSGRQLADEFEKQLKFNNIRINSSTDFLIINFKHISCYFRFCLQTETTAIQSNRFCMKF